MPFRWKFSLLLCLLGGAGFLISGAPQPIDQVTRSLPALGQYFIFLFWFAGVLGWGEALDSLLGRSSLEPGESLGLESGERPSIQWVRWLSLGTLAATFFAGTFSFLLPYGPSAKIWATLLILLGILKSATRPSLQLKASFVRLGPWAKLMVGVLGVAVLMRSFEAYRMIRHGDQYAVYLTGPRLWFDAHSFRPFLANPLQFLTSTWDYLTLWGNLLLAGAPGEGLDGAQRFAQWTTVSAGYAGLIFALYAVLSEAILDSSDDSVKSKLPSAFILTATLAAVSIPSLNWTATLVKSDMGVCFWSIAALLILFADFTGSHSRSVSKSAFLGGLLLGGAVMAKPPAVVFAFFTASLAVIRILQLHDLKKALQATGWITLGGVLAAGPVLGRNLLLTGNPFYPWLGNLFPSDLTGPMLTKGFNAPTVAQIPLTWTTYWSYLKEVLLDNPFNAASLLCLVPAVSSRGFGIPKKLTWFAAIAWLSALAFDWKLRPATELRYLGPALPLIAGLGIVCTSYVMIALARRLKKPLLVSAGGALLTVFIIATSKIPLHVLKRIPHGYFVPAALDVLEHDGGKAKQWMRQNVRPDELILALSDNYFYYTLGLNYIEIQHYKPTDEVFTPATDGKKMVLMMGQFHARYFHHLIGIGGPLKPVLEPLRACRVYEDAQARIYDVPCLIKSVESRSVQSGGSS